MTKRDSKHRLWTSGKSRLYRNRLVKLSNCLCVWHKSKNILAAGNVGKVEPDSTIEVVTSSLTRRRRSALVLRLLVHTVRPSPRARVGEHVNDLVLMVNLELSSVMSTRDVDHRHRVEAHLKQLVTAWGMRAVPLTRIIDMAKH